MYHILYVDDEEDLLTITKLSLEKTGEFLVDTCTSSHEVLASGTLSSYDAIISDLQMPERSGIEFLKAVRSEFADLPFISFTGRGREEVIIEAINEGINFYIQKGDDPSSQFPELAHKVKQAIEQRVADIQCSIRGKDQKRILDVLHESEEKYRTLVENMQDGVFIAQDMVIKFVNEPYARLLGYSREEILGQHIRQFIDEQDLMFVMERHKRRMSGETLPDQYDFHLIHRDKTKNILVSMNVSTIMYHGNIAAIGTIRDVTEKRRAETALRESEERYRTIFENTGTAMVIIAEDTTIILANSRFERLSGYSCEEIEGKKSWADFVAVDDLQWMREQHQIRREKHEAALTTYEFRFISRYGEVHHIMLTIDVIPGTPRSVASLLDITDRKKMEESIVQVNSRLNLMNSITRHDIRNKVSVLNGYLDIVEDIGVSDEVSTLLEPMRGAITAITSQIEFSKLYQNLGTKKPEWIRIQGILPTSHVPSSIAFIVDIPDMDIYADPMLEKVFENLLDNSVRHGGDVHSIRISMEKCVDGLLLIWADDGAGIPDEEKPFIFERGYGKNTGLGLYLISNILSITGLTITEVGKFGHGARFEIHCYLGSFRIQEI
ncbi:MAG: PAS domain S-box protein [Methanobacteriota archaeon]